MSKSDGYIEVKRTMDNNLSLIPILCNCCEDNAVVSMSFKKANKKLETIYLCKEHVNQLNNILNFIRF